MFSARSTVLIASALLALVAPGGASASQSNLFPEERTSGPALLRTRADRLAPTVPPNELCVRARVTKLVYLRVAGAAEGVDYCQLPVPKVVPLARGTIERVGELHERIADAIGVSTDALFGPGFELEVHASDTGSLNSVASFRGVTLKVLPGWTLEDFPSMVYAHEIMHTLAFNPGPYLEAVQGVVDHPMIFEALPDLISAVVHDTPRIRLGETKFPAAIRDFRDATPVRSLDEPFRAYYFYSSAEEIARHCEGLDRSLYPPAVARICAASADRVTSGILASRSFREQAGIVATPFDAEHLDRAFEAEDCAYRARNGVVGLDNCDSHQFARPLVSFFFRLKEATGSHRLREFLAALRSLAAAAPAYECRYAHGTRALGGVKFSVRIRPLLGALVAVRESLPAADRPAFDRAWNEAGFGRLVDLDRFYRREMLGTIALLMAKIANPQFAGDYGCTELYSLDPEQCRVECVQKAI